MQRSKEKKIVIRDSEAEQHLRAMREAREAAGRADREAGAQPQERERDEQQDRFKALLEQQQVEQQRQEETRQQDEQRDRFKALLEQQQQAEQQQPTEQRGQGDDLER